MRNIFLLIFGFLVFSLPPCFSQEEDTLRHLSTLDTLTVYTYDGPNQWGYITGHNHLGRQEYAEKYIVNGAAKVTAIISHHHGVVRNDKNVGSFIIYAVNEKGLPGDILNTKLWYFGDLDLSGNAQFTALDKDVDVVDSFFVSFNLTDYSHGGFEGDTLALMTGLEGSREESDLAIWARNVTRFHNHSTPDFRDFYYQNGTPIATHFALYPIVEFDNTVTATRDQFVQSDQLKLFPPYPNPVRDNVNLRFSQSRTSQVLIKMYDVQGKEILDKDLGVRPAGDYTESINISRFTAGRYMYTIQSGATRLAGKLLIE